MPLIPVVIAQDATGAGSSWILLVLMVAVFWLFIIRPQRTRMKKQQELASSLQVGDEVQTIGGLKGRVVSLDGDDVVLEVEQGRIKIVRRAVANKVTETPPGPVDGDG